MLAWYQGACTAGVLVDTLELMTEGHVLASVSSDYRAMENMMFGEKPVFDQILAVLQSLQEEINA